jgi:hypothetical protein
MLLAVHIVIRNTHRNLSAPAVLGDKGRRRRCPALGVDCAPRCWRKSPDNDHGALRILPFGQWHPSFLRKL